MLELWETVLGRQKIDTKNKTLTQVGVFLMKEGDDNVKILLI